MNRNIIACLRTILNYEQFKNSNQLKSRGGNSFADSKLLFFIFLSQRNSIHSTEANLTCSLLKTILTKNIILARKFCILSQFILISKLTKAFLGNKEKYRYFSNIITWRFVENIIEIHQKLIFS